jgi:hypothetical protein
MYIALNWRTYTILHLICPDILRDSQKNNIVITSTSSDILRPHSSNYGTIWW